MSRPWLRFDFILFSVVLGLIGMGLTLIYSATVFSGFQTVSLADSPFFRQAAVAGVGIVLLLVLAAIDYEVLTYHPLASMSPLARRKTEPADVGLALHHEQYSEVDRGEKRLGVMATVFLLVEALTNPFYIVAVLLLASVPFLGKSAGGAQRWLSLGLFDVQPSELTKLLLIIAMARYMSDHEDSQQDPRHLLVTLVQVAIPVVLVARQPDLGTALTLCAVWLGMTVMSGVSWRYLLTMGIAAALSAPVVWSRLLNDYQRERLVIFLDPQRDPLGAGYNIIQSRISVGAGGLLGRGLNSGTQSQLHFLRIQHTDYIFSVLGEELGFIGGAVLIGLYAILLLQALTIASGARDTFGRLIGSGIVCMLLFQIFVNIGMNIGLSPVTGIPLPFISYGRSSLLTILLSIGILESIAIRRRPPGVKGSIAAA